MRCPSCNASYGDLGHCSECGAIALSFADAAVDESASIDPDGSSNKSSTKEPKKKSTLIEFPGVVRSTVPDWRRELSERVREVQERRAREAAAEAAEAERLKLTAEDSSPPPQLELLPQATAPAMNPLVAAALRRIERANRPTAPAPAMSHAPARATATAIAYAPDDELESTPDKPSTTPTVAVDVERSSVEVKPELEKTHNLVVVRQPETIAREKKPKRLISDHDPSLNYLDAISTTMCIDEVDVRRAGMFRRFVAAIVDLFFCALLFSPFIAAVEFTNGDWNRPQVLAIAAGAAGLVMFLYFTTATAFSGRTLGMRLLGLTTLDKRTGMIPSGTQSAGRALFFVCSLFTAVPILLSLFDRDGRTVHDRLTGTVVLRK